MSVPENAEVKLINSAVFIAFGANLGSCRSTFVRARQCLIESGVTVVASSPIYCGAAVGGPHGQPDYFNAVIQVTISMSAHELLNLCQRIEEKFGRQRLQHWGARTLDLDILACDQLVCNDEQLTLPHPRLHLRRFVLEPLCCLDKNWYHPLLCCRAEELLQQLEDEPQLCMVAQTW